MQDDRGSIPMRATPSCKGLVALGHILLDIIGVVETLPALPGQVASGNIHIDGSSMHTILDTIYTSPRYNPEACLKSLGGGAAVTAMIAANLGLSTTFLGSIGNDTEGELVSKLLTREGTRFSPTYSDRETGTFLSLKDIQGNRLLSVSPSAARDIRNRRINDSELQQSCVLYIDGLLIDSEAWLTDIACRARQKSMTIIMDFSTPGNARTNAEALRAFVNAYCDIVFGNEREVEAVYGKEIRGKLTTTVALVEKRGEGGAVLHYAGRSMFQPASKVAVHDTTCAGDALAAGFILGLGKGLEYGDCLSLGIRAASIAIQYVGSEYDHELMKKSIAEELSAISSKLNR